MGAKAEFVIKILKNGFSLFLKFFNGKLFRPSKPHHKFAHLLFWGSGWGRQKKCNFFLFSLIFPHFYLSFFTFLFFANQM